MLEKIKGGIKQLFGEEGSVSMMRMVSFVTVVDILSVWSYTCIATKKVEDVPTNVLAIFVTVISGKVLQKFKESKTTS
jgi:hypothetical protein